MLPRLILLLVILATPCRAQDWTGYTDTSLDAVYAKWDEVTKTENPGLTMMPPEKLHFFAKYAEAPKPCRNGMLHAIFDMQGFKDVLTRIPTNHCILLTSAQGRSTPAFIQDKIVPGLIDDGKVGGQIEVYADLLGYVIEAQRAQNHPTLLVNRFEPK